MCAVVLINNVIPVFVVAALGYIAARPLNLDGRTISRMALYLLTPALVFNSLSTAKIMPGEFALIVASALTVILVMIGLGVLSSRLFGLSASTGSAVALGAGLMNAGNFGLPITLFTLGQAGFDRAVILMVMMSIATNTLGVFISARGRRDTRDALRSVLGMPAIYAAAAGLLCQALGWQLPTTLARPIKLLADASVPVFLIALGIQLRSVKLQAGFLKAVSLTSILRLVVSPLLAFGVTMAFGLGGIAQKAVILECSMPVAVNTCLLAAEYDSEPELASTSVMVSTLLSIVTLTIVIALLGRLA